MTVYFQTTIDAPLTSGSTSPPETMNTVDVAVHTLGDKEIFNNDIAEMLGILERPLPLENLSSAKLLPIFPPDCQHQIDAICSQLATSAANGDSRKRIGTSRPVTDVLDVILTSVLLLRTSRHCSHGFTERKSNWVSMLSACGLAISEAVVCSDDIGFARARTRFNADVLNLRDFERKATVAMSIVVPPTLRHCPNDDVPDSTADEDSGSTSNASHDSYVTMDLPFDAHVTPARGKRVDCTLPVVFAARFEEMQELMTSLVCQRRVMGISTPVVGISLPDEGTYASLVLGWYDASQPTIVNIAYPPLPADDTASESLPLGVFDGSNPISTLRLAQFVLDLEPYFASLKAQVLHPQVQDFCWRLDHAHFDHSHIWNSKPDKSPSPHDDTSRISSWQATLPFAETPDPDPPFSSETPDTLEDVSISAPLPTSGTPSSPEAIGTLSNMSRATRSSTRQSSITNPTSPSDSLHPSTAEKPRPASQADSASDGGESDAGLSDAGSAKSDGASKFAKIFDPDDPRGLGLWTRERETILLFLIPIQLKSTAIEHQINSMIEFYEDVTRFVWIRHWVSLDRLPSCDPSLEYVRKAFFKAHHDHTRPELLIDRANSTCKIMESRLSGFFNVVATAATSTSNSRDGAHVEAGTRGAWDQAFRLVSCDPDAAVSDTYFVERTISLAANKAVREKQKFQAQHLANLLRTLTLGQSISADKTEDLPRALLPITTQALTQALSFVNTVRCYLSVGHYVKEAERQNEPAKAKADGMYCVRYDLKAGATQARVAAPTQSSANSEEPPAVANPLAKRGLATTLKKFLRLGAKKHEAPTSCSEPSRLRALQALKKKALQTQGNVKQAQADQNDGSSQGEGSEEAPQVPGKTDEWEVIAPLGESPLNVPHIRCFTCTNVTRSMAKDDRPLIVPNIPASRPDTELLVPFVYTEYKRDGVDIHQAFNQIKLYCTSGLEFLASIGVTDFPVWGVVCAGNEGVIVMAWKSTKSMTDMKSPEEGQSNYNFIFDRNVKRFNLSDPLQAFHFFTSIHRIHLQKDKLLKKLKSLPVAHHLRDSKRQRWMMPPKAPTPSTTNANKS